MLIEARSTVGPISFGAIGVTGWIETEVSTGAVRGGAHTRAHLEIAVDGLRSGNSLYDAELSRRIDAAAVPERDRSTCASATKCGRRSATASSVISTSTA